MSVNRVASADYSVSSLSLALGVVYPGHFEDRLVLQPANRRMIGLRSPQCSNGCLNPNIQSSKWYFMIEPLSTGSVRYVVEFGSCLRLLSTFPSGQ
jgi:hypothetical protein